MAARSEVSNRGVREAAESGSHLLEVVFTETQKQHLKKEKVTGQKISLSSYDKMLKQRFIQIHFIPKMTFTQFLKKTNVY